MQPDTVQNYAVLFIMWSFCVAYIPHSALNTIDEITEVLFNNTLFQLSFYTGSSLATTCHVNRCLSIKSANE